MNEQNQTKKKHKQNIQHMQNSNEIEPKLSVCRDHACVANKNCIEMFTDALLAVNRRRNHRATERREGRHRTHK